MARGRINSDVINKICTSIDFTKPFNINEIAENSKDLFIFDVAEEERRFRVKCVRRVFSAIRDENGQKKIYAIGDRSGDHIDIYETTDKVALSKSLQHIKNQTLGLLRTQRKMNERLRQIDGQESMFEAYDKAAQG